MAENNLGCIHIYYGNGKGKTTCSVGLAVRASGCGKKVLFIQFMKTGKSSEIKVIENLPGIEVMEAPRMKKFSFKMNDEEKREMLEEDNRVLDLIREKVSGENYDLLVMDESIGSCHKGFLDEALLIDFLKNKPEHLEVVLTGRHPDDTLMDLADYVTEMHKVKHPYDKGTMARRGIEF